MSAAFEKQIDCFNHSKSPIHLQNEEKQCETIVLKRQEMNYSEKEDEQSFIRRIKLSNRMKKRKQKKIESIDSKYSTILKFKERKEYKIIRIIELQEPSQDCFAFGELILEGDFFKDPYDLDKTYNWSFWKCGESVQLQPDLSCILIQYNRKVQTKSDLARVAQKYLHTPNSTIHKLGEYLQKYDQQIKTHLQKIKAQKWLQEAQIFEKLKQLSLEYFQNFCEMDLETLDNNYHRIGLSYALLKLLGLSPVDAVSFIMRKGRIEFMDGFSRAQRLLFRLEQMLNLTQTGVTFGNDIITTDGICIPIQATYFIPDFQCATPQNFSYFDDLFSGLVGNFAGLRLVQLTINPNILAYVNQIREKSISPPVNVDFGYSLLSEMFIEKYYPKKDDKVCGFRYLKKG